MKKKKCKKCLGNGWVINPKYKGTIFMILPPDNYTIECPECHGTGKRGRHNKDD